MQTLSGDRDVSTTMVYTHVLSRGPLGVRSPVDRLRLGDPGRAGGAVAWHVMTLHRPTGRRRYGSGYPRR